MAEESLPPIVRDLARDYPGVWQAYNRLGDEVAASGPLDDRTARVVKLALAIGAGRQGAVHSHARRALKAGLSLEELRQIALLAITTLGWSGAVAAYSWIEDVIGAASGPDAS